MLGADPPELPVAQLVHVAGLFGINENRARVALSRMVASAEATTDGAGRYALAGHLLERQQRQAFSRAGRTARWTGEWHMVVVSGAGADAEVRARRRRALTGARLAELRQGTWLRPDNLELQLDASSALSATLGADGVVFMSRPQEDPVRLAHMLWDQAAWATRARHLLARLEALTPRSASDLAPGFVLSAAVLRHFQADPLLPDELVPANWPGRPLRLAYDDWDRRYRQVLAAWSRIT